MAARRPAAMTWDRACGSSAAMRSAASCATPASSLLPCAADSLSMSAAADIIASSACEVTSAAAAAEAPSAVVATAAASAGAADPNFGAAVRAAAPASRRGGSRGVCVCACTATAAGTDLTAASGAAVAAPAAAGASFNRNARPAGFSGDGPGDTAARAGFSGDGGAMRAATSAAGEAAAPASADSAGLADLERLLTRCAAAAVGFAPGVPARACPGTKSRAPRSSSPLPPPCAADGTLSLLQQTCKFQLITSQHSLYHVLQ